MSLSIFRLVRSLLLVLFIAVVEYKRGSFTLSGTITGFIVCFIIAYSNIVFLLIMITFVLSCTFATRYNVDLKLSKLEENDHQIATRKRKRIARNYQQVLCNSVIACFFALGYCWKTNYSGLSLPFDNKHESSIYSIGFIFSVVCCCGDTLGKYVNSFRLYLYLKSICIAASEMGTALAHNRPRLITNPFRTVPTGTNGGISSIGCLFSLFGGLIIGLSFVTGNMIFCQSEHMINTFMINIQLLFYCAIFGFLGSLIDSLLGATLQFSGYDRERNVIAEKPLPFIEQISGLDILSNNQVNLISSFLTSIMAMVILPKVIV